VLEGPAEPRDVAARIRTPSPDCASNAQHPTGTAAELYDAPLPAELRARTATLVRGLHPAAKQVVRRLDSIWFAHDIPGAEARFVPCFGHEGGQGLVLLDANTTFGEDVSDADVPLLYWGLLGTAARPAGLAAPSTPDRDRATRYVLLHELGHALSLLSGELRLGPTGQFDVNAWDGFVDFSWRPRLPNAVGERLHLAGGLVPTRLALLEWRRLRLLLGSEPNWLAPGYRTVPTPRAGSLCDMVHALPRAGFVTPTAATAPTEDYAELFAHAILADEGRIEPEDAIVVTLDGCAAEWLHPPYFAPGVSAKRSYLERQLGLRK
jgi:hypothetical protein